MASNRESTNGSAARAGVRLLRGDPVLAARVARSLLAERRRLRRAGVRVVPRRHVLRGGGARELARRGGRIDPDLAFRALEHAIDPEWTLGHRFRVGYELTGEGGGSWTVVVDDGSVRVEPGSDAGGPETWDVVRVSTETWRQLVSGELNPTSAMQAGLTEVDGDLPAVTLMGRWIDRAEGRDGPELEREATQRELQR